MLVKLNDFLLRRVMASVCFSVDMIEQNINGQLNIYHL